MDFPQELPEQVNDWFLHSIPADLPIKYVIYYCSNFSFYPNKVVVAITESKERREARIKYNMTHPKVSVSTIKNSTENVVISTLSDWEEYMESSKQYELERQEFVGEPYYTEFRAEEEREHAEKYRDKTLNALTGKYSRIFGLFQESMGERLKQSVKFLSAYTLPQKALAQELAMLTRSQETIRQQVAMFSRPQETIRQQVAMFSRPQETIRQQVAMFSRPQESINLALNSSLRSVRQAASIHTDYLKSVRQAASIHTDYLKSVRQAASIHTDYLKSVRQAASIHTDYLKSVRLLSKNLKF